MDLSEINAITKFGMNYESMRVKVASSNIAFANQKSSSPNEVYKTMAVDIQGFYQNVQQASSFSEFAQRLSNGTELSVKEVGAVKSQYLPKDPSANNAGYVFRPDINMTNEMLTLTTAIRAYEANVKAYNTASSMSKKALEIGK